MKKNFLFLLAIIGVVAFSSCHKPEPEDVKDPREPYLGTYDMVMMYDSVGVDGDWDENGSDDTNYDPDNGFVVLSANPNNENTINLDGYEIFSNANGGTDTIHFYETKFALNDGVFTAIEPSKFEMNGYLFNITYGMPQFTETDGHVTGLQFRIEQHTVLMGMDCGYILTAHCVKRTE